MSSRYQHCFGCNTRLGEKTAAGLLVGGRDGVIVDGDAHIRCPRCKKRVKVRVAFQASKAQQDGLSSILANQNQKVPKDGIDWNVIKELHETNRMEIFPQSDGSLVLVAKPDTGEVERVLKTIENEVLNNPNLTPQQREAIMAIGHEASQAPPPQPPPQQQQQPAPRPLPPSYAPHTIDPAAQRTANTFRQSLPAEDDGIPSGIPAESPQVGPSGPPGLSDGPGPITPPEPSVEAPANDGAGAAPEPVAAAESPSQPSGGRHRGRNR